MDYIKIESENQKSGLIILLLFHSACQYKNYCLKCFTELQTSFCFFFFYLVISVSIASFFSSIKLCTDLNNHYSILGIYPTSCEQREYPYLSSSFHSIFYRFRNWCFIGRGLFWTENNVKINFPLAFCYFSFSYFQC